MRVAIWSFAHMHAASYAQVLAERTGTYHVHTLPKVHLSILLNGHNVDKTLHMIMQAVRTGEAGDGDIFHAGGGGHAHPHRIPRPRGADVTGKYRRAQHRSLTPRGVVDTA